MWKIENYADFLEQRRILLAKAANEFLDSLLTGQVPEDSHTGSILDRDVETVPGGIASEEEEEILLQCMTWMDQQSLPIGEFEYELVNDENKQLLAVLDLAWPDGIQVGLTQPIALLLYEDDETLQIAQRHGYRCFTNFELFRRYVQQEVLGIELVEP
ncbi:MAG: hypothetical protein AAFY41_06275 [Bacteroidota bacterium]